MPSSEAMALQGKSLGLLVSAAPQRDNFTHALRLAESALARGVKVYFYCVDEAIDGLADKRLERLKDRGLNLFACAFGIQRRRMSSHVGAALSGLAVLSDLMGDTDRFVSFN